ncbi:DUF3034 family protein [Allosphingosinicella indica]|uniref:DUF3034 family protein n=1 Tax=Allosphingosinicella indica TaxID=941907 RepID=A0A1X7GBX8_9SPHN|nr:DUF3034 family protein [Allosphingosinicella indica]SMF67422.1 Protein of unknown function [Allosphingosinicella indica]
MAGPAAAQDLRWGGKLLLTDAATSVEGAAGGGLASWAVIGGHATDAGIGGGAHGTYVVTDDFSLTTFGAKIGLFDRVELSWARQSFDTRDAGAALGLGRGFTFGQDVFGAKLRVVGDAVYDQDRVLPQISLGIQHKRADEGAVIAAVGGRNRTGTDFYVAATKVLLGQSLVVNGTARLTKANQFGLLGFGGDRKSGHSLQFEGSVGTLVTRRLLVGAEVRTKPDNLGFAKEQDSFDLFAAWQLHRNVTLTAAYVDLGSIATFRGQQGAYLSLQTAF